MCATSVVLLLMFLYKANLDTKSVADPGFSRGGAPAPKLWLFYQFFAENCMKMKEFGPQAGARSWRPPLDPPMEVIDKL